MFPPAANLAEYLESGLDGEDYQDTARALDETVGSEESIIDPAPRDEYLPPDVSFHLDGSYFVVRQYQTLCDYLVLEFAKHSNLTTQRQSQLRRNQQHVGQGWSFALKEVRYLFHLFLKI